MNTFIIHRIAKLTGLSKDVIRVWERRYGLLKPSRGANRYRIYTDEDVALLRYIKEEMDKGESIGDLAELGREELLSRIPKGLPELGNKDFPSFERFLGELIHDLAPFDRINFERRLNGAIAVIPFEEAFHGILLPLQERVGDLWHEGRLGIGVEHFVTNLVQQKIFSAMNQLPVSEIGPKVVVVCPEDEAHEVGSQAAAYRCGLRGCRVFFLGAKIPFPSLASFCLEVHPDLLLFSIPLRLSESKVTAFFEKIKNELKVSWKMAAGGYGAIEMKGRLEQNNIQVLENFHDLDEVIQQLQRA